MTNYDVIIVGAGITGLSAAYHLKQAGVAKIALIAPEGGSATAASVGAVSASFFDNYTRLSHAHGTQFAKEFYHFSTSAFNQLEAYAQARKLGWQSQRRWRLIVSEAEIREAEVAVSQQQSAGIACDLYEPAKLPGSQSLGRNFFGERVLRVQDDGGKAAWIDVAALQDCLRRELSTVDWIDSKVTTISGQENGLELTLASAGMMRASFVVLACHLDIGALVPNLAPALVSVADQRLRLSYSGEKPIDEKFLEGVFFSANHGYEWGVFGPHNQLEMAGARFLRKLAGIGATVAEPDDKISTYLQNQVAKTFPHLKFGQIAGVTAGLDCRPCDELPIIGPMFGEERVLVATGYMGSGISHGFFAGKCLTDLIAKGRSEDLPDRLLPRRLRSIPAE